MLTETWLRKSSDLDENKVTLSKLLPEGFEIKHTPRPDGRAGGCVVIVYSDAISVKIQNCFTQRNFKQFEFMSVMVNFRNACFCLTVVYRPPPSRKNNLKLKCFWKDWSDLLMLHINSNFEFVIVGDLNLHIDLVNNTNTLKFQSLLEEFNLIQHIQEKTHIHGHTLDILITNCNSNIASHIEVFDANFSTDDGQPVNDHYAIRWEMKGVKKKPEIKEYKLRCWKNLNHEIFDLDLSTALSQPIPESVDRVVIYNQILEGLRESHAPIKVRKKYRKLNPWYSDELQSMKTKRRQLERKQAKSGSDLDKLNYKRQCSEYNKCLNKAVLNFNKTMISDNKRDQKKLHSIANKLMGTASKERYPTASSTKVLADSFMQFFINKVKDIRETLSVINSNTSDFPASNQNSNIPQLSSFEPTTEAEVGKVIKNMPSKHCKLDPIPTWLLKKHLDKLTPMITDIINQSLQYGIIHPSLKAAIIRPLIKSPSLDHTKYESFRPVSNLPFLAKVLEKIVYARLNTHLTANNLLQVNQSSYKKYHSTETAMLKIQNDILVSLDKDKIVALVTLDISAAFDTVDHDRLLKCFNSKYGITGTALQWMKSYLSGRTQRVSIDNWESFIALIEYGFPQGAVLAGILYNMYSAQLNVEIEKHPADAEHHSYADDNSFYISFSIKDQDNALESLQLCVNYAKDWLNTNLLQVNDDKTRIIYFTPKKDMSFIRNSITIGTYVTNPRTPVKYLGIQMDSLLNLEKHVNSVTSTAYYHLRNISKIRQALDIDSAKSLVQSLVISRLDFCNSILSKYPQRLTSKLQRVQNHAARVIFKKKKRDHMTPYLKELHWLPVRSRVTFKILLLTYKCLNGLAPAYLSDLINLYIPPRTLRSNTTLTGTLVVPRYNRLKHGGRAFSYVSPLLWNCLPNGIRNAVSVSLFKSLLKTHLFREYFE